MNVMTNHSEKSLAERRDEVVKRMLATPPQPKVGPKKGKASRASDEVGRGAKPET